MENNPIHDKCVGCDRIVLGEDSEHCKVYPVPESKWRLGNCPMATHIAKTKEEKKMVDPLKANKQSMKRKK